MRRSTAQARHSSKVLNKGSTQGEESWQLARVVDASED